MAAENYPNAPAFAVLNFGPTPWSRWAASFALNSVIVLGTLLSSALLVEKAGIPIGHVLEITTLEPYRPPAPPRAIPPAKHPPVRIAKVQRPVPQYRPVKRIEIPIARLQSPRQKLVKTFDVPVIETPKIDLPKIEPAIIEAKRPELFPALPAAPGGHSPALVKTGGFGDNNGVPVNNASTRPSALGVIGDFDLSPGTSRGAGPASRGGKGTVALAGFGDGQGVGSGSGSGVGRARQTVQSSGFGDGLIAGQRSAAERRAPVANSGFNDFETKATPAKTAQPAKPAETPVEITWKPKPAYTPAAREKRLEGDVELEVLFSSTGEVRVLRLVKGLGAGLDESAREAATHIRFHPGTRNGAPVDVTGIVHITFQLS